MRANQYIAVKGRITADPELQTSKDGKKYLKLSLAINNKVKNAEGELEDVATFYNLLSFDKMAEIYSKIKKGAYVRAEGKLSIRPYLSKENQPKVDLTVMLEDLMESIFIGGDDESEPAVPSSEEIK